MNTEQKIQKQLDENPIILYMKGVPDNPECGFSARTVQALNSTGIAYTYVNVLAAPFIRERLPKISKWPTFPQLFVNGELIGGCDIVESMQNDGSLTSVLQQAEPKLDDSDNSIITPDEVQNLIKNEYPDAKIYIEGEGCDLMITVVSDQFEAQPMIKQQQGVMACLSEPLGSGRLHAVSIKAHTHTQWNAIQQNNSNNGLIQIQNIVV